uniref:Uncharacterized protein n=1 Tax=Tanacetum cinerariifolium TaxID=118510 RepID=A0A699HM64_TANCI|nr:hypothetical protein [Tanacetum cinerariifolium]
MEDLLVFSHFRMANMNSFLLSTSFLSTVTKLVDLIELQDHLNSIFIPKCNGSWRVDYREVVLVFKASGIPSRFAEVELSLVAFNPQVEVFYALSDNQLSGP